jgi:hypothetical protein
MKKIFYYSLLFTLSITIFSCTKDNKPSFSGRVLTYGSLDPVPNAMVYVVAGEGVGLFEPPIEWIADSILTNEDGTFSIAVSGGDYYYIHRIHKEGFFPELGNQVTTFTNGNSISNQDIIIDPIGTLHVIVENDPGTSANYIRLNLPGIPSLDLTNNYENYIKNTANRYHYYLYTYDFNEYFKDSIFLMPFDTTQLRITF